MRSRALESCSSSVHLTKLPLGVIFFSRETSLKLPWFQVENRFHLITSSSYFVFSQPNTKQTWYSSTLIIVFIFWFSCGFESSVLPLLFKYLHEILHSFRTYGILLFLRPIQINVFTPSDSCIFHPHCKQKFTEVKINFRSHAWVITSIENPFPENTIVCLVHKLLKCCGAHWNAALVKNCRDAFPSLSVSRHTYKVNVCLFWKLKWCIR